LDDEPLLLRGANGIVATSESTVAPQVGAASPPRPHPIAPPSRGDVAERLRIALLDLGFLVARKPRRVPM
jgi:hypothetical protein